MRRSHWLPPTALAIAALALGAACAAGALLAGATSLAGPTEPATASGATAPASASAPVVVELFTSQGCSTCPPADHLLSQLGGAQPGGAQPGQVIALAYHVDYWNQTGWTDPFSSHKWSERQARYGRALNVSSIYTPELVVNGRSECVGNKRDEVMRKIAEAQAAEPAGKVSLAAEEVADGKNRKLRVKVGARIERPAHGLDLWVALTQSGLTTDVRGGENKSATLHDDFVVRQLKKAFSMPGKEGAERSGEMTIAIDSDWGDASKLAVVAFLQDPSTLAIQGAAAQVVDAAR